MQECILLFITECCDFDPNIIDILTLHNLFSIVIYYQTIAELIPQSEPVTQEREDTMASEEGRNRNDYRKANRGLVLKLVATGACLSRADLARTMGLSRMALSKIVMEMMEQGLLAETEEVRTGEPGRNSIGLQIAETAPKVIGVLIERDRCEAVLVDMNLHIQARERVYIGEGLTEERLITDLFQLIDTILFGQDNVAAIGIACVGPISASEGMILSPLYFYGIHDVPITKILEERYHLPTFLDHDNQSAALAEYLYGAGQSYQDILVLGVGNGVGCGIMSNGHRYANERGLPPEIGHVSIDFNGRRCECGNRGCIEAYIRTSELLRRCAITRRRCTAMRPSAGSKGTLRSSRSLRRLSRSFPMRLSTP